MKLICSQPVMKTERRIEDNQQFTVETEEHLHLYGDRIETPTKSFTIKDVLDVTSKPLSAYYTFLYLHTIEGVWTFIVKSSPAHFITQYHKVK
ncbi:hypothetical protein QTG56_10355 [Rossellomorea sp. AcN35-11]|nr:hypothetical protein [Rossellomorea aquimaris]NMH67479.1 hypothetical protein [Bacillus sp. RO3]WJV31289.1 hypothetical protein QTG56_10355 [Rossellomorea sp. AcN35-11]